MSRKFTFSIAALFEKAGFKKGKDGLKDINKEASSLSEKFDKLKTKTGGFLKSLKKIGTTGLKFIAGLAVGYAALAVEVTKTNVGLARAVGLIGGGMPKFLAFRKEIGDLSSELGLAKSQLVDGLYQAISAGVPEDNVFTFLKTAAKTAIADGSDVKTVVDGLSTVLNAFKIEATETEKVADKMFKTVAIGKTTFGELSSSLSQVAPIASSMGVSIDEVLAAVATLTKSGTPTAQAMTQIRQALISTNTVMGDGWTETMTLQEAFLALEKQAGGSQNELKNMLGSVEAMNAVLGLTGKNAAIATEDLKELKDSAGTLKENFDFTQQFRSFQRLGLSIKNVFQTGLEIIDDKLRPAINTITNSINSWKESTGFFDDLRDRVSELATTVEGLFEAFKSGQGRAIYESLADLLKAAIGRGGELAAKAILTIAPLAGRAMAKGILELIKPGNTTREASRTAFNQTREQLGREPNREFIGSGISSLLKGKAIVDEEFTARFRQNLNAALSKAIGGGEIEGMTRFQIEFQAAKDKLSQIAEGGRERAERLRQAVEAQEIIWDQGNETIAEYVIRVEEWTRALESGSQEFQASAETSTQKSTEAAQKAKQNIDAAGTQLQAAAEESSGKIGTAIIGVGNSVKTMADNTARGLNSQTQSIQRQADNIERLHTTVTARLNNLENKIAATQDEVAIQGDQIANLR